MVDSKTIEIPERVALRVDKKWQVQVKPDIWPIYLDLHERQALGLNPYDVVKVRRDLKNLFLQEFRDFGILFLLSMFTLSQLRLIQDIIPNSWLGLIVFLFASLFIAVTIIMVNIRSRA